MYEYIGLTQSARYCKILMHPEFSGHVVQKHTSMKFNENPSSGAKLFHAGGRTDGWTDRHDESNNHFSQFFRTCPKDLFLCLSFRES